MADKNHIVWCFLDDEQNVRHIVYGLDEYGTPWRKVWNERNKRDTPLNIWLRQRADIPAHKIVARDLSHLAAKQLFTATRRQLLAANADLLGSRDVFSYVTGGGSKRPVIVDGYYFRSLREAARLLGVDHSYVHRRIRENKDARYA
jgi:hypothetical protein